MKCALDMVDRNESPINSGGEAATAKLHRIKDGIRKNVHLDTVGHRLLKQFSKAFQQGDWAKGAREGIVGLIRLGYANNGTDPPGLREVMQVNGRVKDGG